MSKERLFVVGLIAFAAIQSVLLVASCRQGPTKNLQVKSLELVSGGKRLASLKTSEDGLPQFEMYGETGRTRALLEVNEFGPWMRMLDVNGTERIEVQVNGGPGIFMESDENEMLFLIQEMYGYAVVVISEPGEETPVLHIGRTEEGMYVRHRSGDGKMTRFPPK